MPLGATASPELVIVDRIVMLVGHDVSTALTALGTRSGASKTAPYCTFCRKLLSPAVRQFAASFRGTLPSSSMLVTWYVC
jgi:hypothetical protein